MAPVAFGKWLWKQVAGLCCMLLCFVSAASHAQSEDSSYKPFKLRGTINGMERGMIYLLYTTEAAGGMWDSSIVTNGRFSFSGMINKPTPAELSLKFHSFEGLNYATVFLEPGTMTLDVHKDSLRFLNLYGSVSQKENERLLTIKKNTWLQLHHLQKERKTLKAGSQSADNIKALAIKKTLDSLETKEAVLYKKLDHFDSLFIVQNPASYVTAFLIERNLKFEKFAIYPVDDLYNRLPAAVQRSRYGKRIRWEMDKVKKVPVGNQAPPFILTDIRGDKLALADFKNKNYVLLDFWGSWCAPCRNLTPALKAIYENFNSKGLEIISIALYDKEEVWRKAIEEDGTGAWRHALGDSTLGGQYAAAWLPAFFLVDKQGILINRYGVANGYGEKSFWQLYQDLSGLLRKPE